MRRDEVVVVPVGVLSPGVEVPVCESEVTRVILQEDRAAVTEPDAIRPPVVKVEAGEISTGTKKDTAGALLCRFVVDEDVDLFDLGEMTDDLRIDPGDGLEL